MEFIGSAWTLGKFCRAKVLTGIENDQHARICEMDGFIVILVIAVKPWRETREPLFGVHRPRTLITFTCRYIIYRFFFLNELGMKSREFSSFLLFLY